MSTQTKKRRLPAWADSGTSRGRKEKAKAANRNGVFKKANSGSGGGPKLQGDRPRPAVKEESKAANRASSSRAGAKIPSAGLDEDFKIAKSISVLKSTQEVQENIKEEPEGLVEGDPLITGKLVRENLTSTNESESKDTKEGRRRLFSERPQGESKDALQKQNTDGLEDARGKYNSTTHHIKTEVSTSQQQENGKVHRNSLNERLTRHEDVRNDVEDKDTAVFAATQKVENGSREPPVRQFSKLLEGVIFSISGLVNPERAELREMAIDMGAQYRPSWSSDSTLLIAALANTPSFSQVKAVGGTIVHKDWIVECYKRKELVPIEKYMMHVGNPWRAGHDVDECPVIGVEEDSPSQTKQVKAQGNETASDHTKLLSTSTVEDGTRSKVPGSVKGKATRVEIQKWFLEDLDTMRSWLEERHEKPEQDMLEYTAAQGLVACLEDAVRSLEGNEGLKLVLDSWAFIPRAIKELEEELSQVSRTERLVREAERIKSIYTSEIQRMGLGVPPKEDAQTDDDATEIISDTDSRDPADYYSDDTEDLDEDEITQCQIQIMHRFALD